MSSQGEKRLEARDCERAATILDAAFQLLNSLADSEGLDHAHAAVQAMQARVSEASQCGGLRYCRQRANMCTRPLDLPLCSARLIGCKTPSCLRVGISCLLAEPAAAVRSWHHGVSGVQVLKQLAHAHVESQQPGPALNCIQVCVDSLLARQLHDYWRAGSDICVIF